MKDNAYLISFSQNFKNQMKEKDFLLKSLEILTCSDDGNQDGDDVERTVGQAIVEFK